MDGGAASTRRPFPAAAAKEGRNPVKDKNTAFGIAVLLRSLALYEILYQFCLLAGDLPDPPVFAASLFIAFGAAAVLALVDRSIVSGRRFPAGGKGGAPVSPAPAGGAERSRIGPVPALIIIALVPWAARACIALPWYLTGGPQAAGLRRIFDSLLLHLDRNNFISLFPFYWAAAGTFFSIRSRTFLRADIIAGSVLLLVIYCAARTTSVEPYRWPVVMVIVFAGIVLFQLAALLLSMPDEYRLRKREQIGAALVLLLLCLMGGLLFLRPLQERAVEKEGGLLQPQLFSFDFSKYLRLETEISMKDDLALIVKKDGTDPHILLRRYVLSGYSESDGFFRIDGFDEKLHPQRIPDRKTVFETTPFRDSRRVTQEYFMVNFDSTAFIGMNEPVSVTPFENWDASSFSSAYEVESNTSDAGIFELMPVSAWPPGPETTGLTGEEYRIYTKHGNDARIKNLAEEITAGFDRYWDKVQVIHDFLKYGDYRYSLKPGIAPDGDQLSFFLFQSKKGYCSYYAFAMALMLRSIGIPARVAAGFFIDPDSGAFDYYPVLSNMAHAWVEVPFPGYGWIEYDPTTDQLAEGEEFNFSSGVDRNLFERLMKEILENHSRLSAKEGSEAAAVPPGFRSLMQKAGRFLEKNRLPLSVFLLVIIFAAIRLGPLFLYRCTGDPRKKARRLWDHVRRRLALAGFRRDAGQTEAEWAKRMDVIPAVYALYLNQAEARFASRYTGESLAAFTAGYRRFNAAYGRAVSPGRRFLGWTVPPLALLLPGPRRRDNAGGPKDGHGGPGKSGGGPAIMLVFILILTITGSEAQDRRAGADQILSEAMTSEEAEFWERAVELYRSGSEQYPNDVRFPWSLGNLYYYRKLYSLAWDELRRAETLVPGDPDLLYLLSRTSAYLNLDRESVDYLERLIVIDPDNREAIGNLGWMYYKVHRLADGQRLLNEATMKFGGDADFAMTLGTLYADSYRYEEGREWYLRAIEEGEAQGDRSFTSVAWYNLSILESRFYHYDFAFEDTNASLNAQNRTSGRLARGEMQLRRLDFEKALADYEAAYEMDTSPLSKLNLAQLYQISGRLEEARLYAEDCLKGGDLSWMLNYGIDPVRYRRDIHDVLRKVYRGLEKTGRQRPYGRIAESFRSLLRTAVYRFKAAGHDHLFRKFSLAAADAYGLKFDGEEEEHLDALIQYYNAFERYPRRAGFYLDRARAFETSIIPASFASYDLEEGTLFKKTDMILAAIEGFDPSWERDMIAKAYTEAAKTGKPGTGGVTERLFALNRGALRQEGLRLPVELRIEGTGRQLASRLARYIGKAGFDPVMMTATADETGGMTWTGTDLSFRLSVTVPEDFSSPASCELYDKVRGSTVLRKNFPLPSGSRADIAGFVRSLGDAVFTAAPPVKSAEQPPQAGR
jgi:tetratricopeptide (TPR) repeat protein